MIRVKNGRDVLSRLSALLTIVLVLLSIAGVASAQVGKSAWLQLRTTAPFHLQEVAVSADRRVVIVTEPPPHVTADQIATIVGVTSSNVYKHHVGFDGWVADVVLELDESAAADIHERLTRLAKVLFGTSFGFEAVELPLSPRAAPAAAAFDVTAGAADLRRWLMEPATVLLSTPGEEPCKAQTLLDEPSEGVYASDPPGLIVWALPIGTDLATHEAECRRWCVLSDLVLGGIKGKSSVLLIGRLRQLDQTSFPPLRVEQIMQLAAVRKEELAQSYERTHLLAGRWDAKRFHDWAPIFLSAELLDSEYGSLLNLTDQILKSWSEHGQIEYINWPYPRPSKYPFSDALSALVKSPSLTFNWNTAGVGHVIDTASAERVFALRRTGALPVTYIPEGINTSPETSKDPVADLRDYAETAYKYFAESGNPDLARVVQYAALYQMFVAFKVDARLELRREIPKQGDLVMRDAVAAALRKLRDMTSEMIGAAATAAASRSAQLFGIDTSTDHGKQFAALESVKLFVAGTALQGSLEKLTKDHGDTALDSVAMKVVSRPDAVTLHQLQELGKKIGETEDANAIAVAISGLAKEDQELLETWSIAQYLRSQDDTSAADFVAYLAGGDVVKDHYSKAFQNARSSGFIRTPSIVLSSNTTKVSSVGGHNLDAAITRFVEDARTPRGSPTVTRESGGLVIRFHPDDAEGVDLAARRLAVDLHPEENAKSIFKEVAADAAARPAGLVQRLSIVAGKPLDPPMGRVRLGLGPMARGAISRDIAVPVGDRVLVIDAGKHMTFDGKSFYLAETARARADEIVAWLDNSRVRSGNRIRIRCDSGVMNDGELAGLTAEIRARGHRGLIVEIERGTGSTHTADDLRGATLASLESDGAAAREYVGTIEIKSGVAIKIRVYTRHAVDGLFDKVRSTIEHLNGATKPIAPRELKIELNKFAELNDMDFELTIPADAEKCGLTITQAQSKSASLVSGLAA